MATNIAEIILRIRDESSKTISTLTDTAEGYDKAMRDVADAVAKEEAAEKARAAALGLTIQQMREVDTALSKQIASEKSAAEAAKSAAQAAATARNTSGVEGDPAPIIDLAGATEELAGANWQAVQGAQSLKKNLGDMFNQAIAGTDPMQILIQQGGATAEALMQGGSASDVLKAAFGGLMGPMGVAAAALAGLAVVAGIAAAAYASLTEDFEIQQDVIRAQNDAFMALDGLLQDSADTMLDLQVATGALSQEMADLQKSANASFAEFQKGTEVTRAALSALRADQASVTTQVVDAASETAHYFDILGLTTAVIDGLTTTSAEYQTQIDGQTESLAMATGEMVANRTLHEDLAHNIEKKRKAEENATAATKAATAAEKERKKWLDEMKKGIEAFQTAQSFLYEQSIAGDPIAQENARYEELVARINEAAQATGNLEMAEAALNAARLEHFQNTGAQGATNEAASYDMGLGVASVGTSGGGIAIGSAIAASKAQEKPDAGTTASTVMSAAGGAIKAPDAMISTIGGAFGMWGSAIASGVNLLADSGNGALVELSAGLVETVQGIGNSGAAIADFVGSIFGAIIPAVLDAIPAMLTGLMDGLPGILKSIAGLLPELVVGLFKVFYLMAPTLLIQAVKVLADPQVWLDIGKAFMDALLSIFDGADADKKSSAMAKGSLSKGGYFDELFGGVGGKGYQTKNIAGEGGFFDRLFGGVNDEKDVPQYAVGSDYIARTGLAVVHAGETVVPAHGATNSATMDRLGGGRGNTYVINGVIAADTEQLVRHLREAERMGVSIG